MIKLLARIKQKLRSQTARPRQNLQFILIGFALTLLGIALVMGAEYLFQQTLQRELIALFGVGIIAIGCTYTTFGYLCLSILRILFYLEKDEQDK